MGHLFLITQSVRGRGQAGVGAAGHCQAGCPLSAAWPHASLHPWVLKSLSFPSVSPASEEEKQKLAFRSCGAGSRRWGNLHLVLQMHSPGHGFLCQRLLEDEGLEGE